MNEKEKGRVKIAPRIDTNYITPFERKKSALSIENDEKRFSPRRKKSLLDINTIPITPRPKLLTQNSFTIAKSALKDKISFSSLRFTDPLSEEAYWKYMQSKYLVILKFSYIIGFIISSIVIITLVMSTAIFWQTYEALTINSIAVGAFIFSLGITYVPKFDMRQVDSLTLGTLLVSSSCLIRMYWNFTHLVPTPTLEWQILNNTFHPYGYLLIIVFYYVVAALSKLCFIHSTIFALFQCLSALSLWVYPQSPVLSTPQMSIIFFLLGASSSIGFVFLSYLNELKRRSNYSHNYTLEQTNSKLEAEIKALRSSNGALNNLTSPIEKVTDLLVQVVSDPRIGAETAQNLEKVIDLLTQEKLYSPDIEKQILKGKLHLDEDTESWLFNEVSSRKQSRKASQPMYPLKKSPHSSFDLARLTEKEFEGVFENFDSWHFNIFNLEKSSPDNTLNILAYKILSSHDLIDSLHLDPRKLMKFLTTIEKGYRKENPYHNSLHAADVVQSLSVLISIPFLSKKLSPHEKLAIILAAVIHDYDHPGLTNMFLIKTKDSLATLYNDQSPLENHHLSSAFTILRKEECNFLAFMSQEDQANIRRIMIDLVLATDNSRHFVLMSSFNAKVNVGNLDIEKNDDLILLLQMLIKCADVSNPGKKLEVYLGWVDRVVEEFFRQGDQERKLGLPISPFMDRETPKIPKSQINFIEFICAPIYKSIGEQLDMMVIYENSLENLKYWKEKHALQNPDIPPTPKASIEDDSLPKVQVSNESDKSENESHENENEKEGNDTSQKQRKQSKQSTVQDRKKKNSTLTLEVPKS